MDENTIPVPCPRCEDRNAVVRMSPIGTAYIGMCDECEDNYDPSERELTKDLNADGPAERAHKADKALRERRGD
jgi:hypothetical protein